MNNILRNVLMRRSTSQLDIRPIQDEELMEILEEGKMLSNATRNQEWHFTVLQNRGLMKQLGSSYEKMLARVHGDIWGDPAGTGRILVESSLLLIISGHRDIKYAEDSALRKTHLSRKYVEFEIPLEILRRQLQVAGFVVT